MKSILLAGRDCPLSVPEGEIPPGGFSLMLSNDGDMPAADFEAIFAHIKQQNCVFLAVPPMDRDREYTPWPAPALSQKAPAFSGQGGDYLQFLTKTLLPEARHSRPRPHNAGGLLARRLARPLERHAVRGVWADRLSLRLPLVRRRGRILPVTSVKPGRPAGLPLPWHGGGEGPEPAHGPRGGLHPRNPPACERPWRFLHPGVESRRPFSRDSRALPAGNRLALRSKLLNRSGTFGAISGKCRLAGA